MKNKLILLLFFSFNIFAGKAYLAFEINKITAAQAYQLDIDSGVLISKVKKGSSLEKSGVFAYDIVLTLNGEKISSGLDVQRFLDQHKVGDKVTLGILRKGKKIDIITLLDKNIQEKTIKIEEKAEENSESGLNTIFKRMQEQVTKLKKQHQNLFQSQNTLSFSNSSFSGFQTIMDGEHFIKITNSNGKRSIFIKDNANKVIFEGVIDSVEDMKKIPKEVQEKLSKYIKFK